MVFPNGEVISPRTAVKRGIFIEEFNLDKSRTSYSSENYFLPIEDMKDAVFPHMSQFVFDDEPTARVFEQGIRVGIETAANSMKSMLA